MWVARDKDGSLWLHKTFPIRVDNLGRSSLHNKLRPINMCVQWESSYNSKIHITDDDIVFNITWYDEPKEIKIIDL